jgi:hypothetical protein
LKARRRRLTGRAVSRWHCSRPPPENAKPALHTTSRHAPGRLVQNNHD